MDFRLASGSAKRFRRPIEGQLTVRTSVRLARIATDLLRTLRTSDLDYHAPVEGAARRCRIFSDFAVGRRDLRYLHGRIVSSPVAHFAIDKCSRRNYYGGGDSVGAIVDLPAGTRIRASRLDYRRATPIDVDDSGSGAADSWRHISSTFSADMGMGRLQHFGRLSLLSHPEEIDGSVLRQHSGCSGVARVDSVQRFFAEASGFRNPNFSRRGTRRFCPDRIPLRLSHVDRWGRRRCRAVPRVAR